MLQSRLRITFLAVSCVVLLLSVLGLVWFRSVNRCSMTFMWMYPEFLNVPLSKSIRLKYPEYKLILYGEGYYAQRIRSFKLEGIPVLFIPGNAGSGKQVRSLASVSLNKTDNDYMKRNRYVEFNYFSVDFNEELSALYGDYLLKQRDFVVHCIRKIFSLYKHASNPPTQIVIVGHSMGGLVARGIFAAPKFNSSQVSVIITLATPHKAPVVQLDSELIKFSNYVNEWWTNEANSSLGHLAVISIGGGPADILVPSYLTSWPESLRFAVSKSAYPESQNSHLQLYEAITTSMDWIWASADHLCIVWCNQLVVSIVRSLFDMVTNKERLMTENVDTRRESLDFHLLNNPGGKSIKKAKARKGGGVNFGAKTFKFLDLNEIERGAKLFATPSAFKTTILYKLPITESLVGRSVFLLTNQNVEDIAYFCSESVGCTVGESIIGIHELAPPDSRFMHIRLESSMVGKSLVIPAAYNSPKKTLVFKLCNDTTVHRRTVAVCALNSLVPFWRKTLYFSGSLGFLNVTLDGMGSFFQVFSVALIAEKCSSEYAKEQIAAVGFEVFGSHRESMFRHFRHPYNSSDDFWVRLQIPDTVSENFSWPVLHLLLNPGCEYSLRIESSIFQSFGQVLRHLGYFLPEMCVVQLLLLLFTSHWNNVFGRFTLSECTALAAVNGCFAFSLLKEPGSDFLMVIALCVTSVGILFTGYLLAFAILLAILRRANVYHQTIGKAVDLLRVRVPYLRRQSEELVSEKLVTSCVENNGLASSKKEGSDKISECSEKRVGHNLIIPRHESSSDEHHGENCVWTALMQLFFLVFLSFLAFVSCGGAVILITLGVHLYIVTMKWESNQNFSELRKSVEQRMNSDRILLEIHLFAVVFCAPTIIVWVKALQSGIFVGLSPDPIFGASLALNLGLCVPFVPQKILADYRHFLVLGLAVYANCMDNFIPGLCFCLCVPLGLYLNEPFKRGFIEPVMTKLKQRLSRDKPVQIKPKDS